MDQISNKSVNNPVLITGGGTHKKMKKDVNQIKSELDQKSDEKMADQTISFFQLFRFASNFDMFLIIISVSCAVASGVCFPLTIIYFGEIMNAFITKDFPDADINTIRCNRNNTYGSYSMAQTWNKNDTILEAVRNYAVGCGVVSLISIILTFTFVTCLNIAAQNQVYRLRSEFMKSLMKQDIAWYDAKNSNDFASRITENLKKIEEGIGEKIGMAISYLSLAIVCVIISFAYGWELTLVTVVSVPFSIALVSILGKIQTRLTHKELALCAFVSGIAEEVISAVRTVVVFGGQQKESQHYRDAQRSAEHIAIQRGMVTAIGAGVSWFICYASYALCFWYGIHKIIDNCTENNSYNAASLNIVFYCIFYGSMKIGQTLPFIAIFSSARGAATSIYEIIDRVPPIDSSSPIGIVPCETKGNISFNQVHFQYSTRPGVTILNGISFQISAGQTVALVGMSGCGKSTCIQLLQRFYDPCQGVIELDGRPLSDYNIKWLRAQFGVVGQEPVLFATTIAENIRYGHSGVSDTEIQRAAEEANAHGFISQLPLKYETVVGERGAQLSGGQKQRIAIARALIGNPKILLFDEATSALDTQSEYVVQKALDRARSGRTTIVIAHRLTTIKNADLILALDKGVVKEVGNHDTLMSKCGLYYQLVKSQKQDEEEEKKDSTLSSRDLQSRRNRKEQKSPAEEKESSLDEIKMETLHQGAIDLVSRKPIITADESGISLWRIFQFNRPEWCYISWGVFGSSLMGVSMPIYAIVYGSTMGILDELELDVIRNQKNFYALMFFLLGIATGIGAFFQSYMFAVAGEKLTSRLRALTFSSILKQEIAFFDRQENSVGSLCSRLSSDASNIQGAIGVRIGMLVQIAVCLLVSLGVSIYYNWKLGLVLSTAIPFVIWSGVLSSKIGDGQNTERYKSLEKAGAIAMESISNIRTVTSLGQQETFHKLYMTYLTEPYSAAKRSSPIRGMIFAVAINVTVLISIASFSYGGYLILNENADFKIVCIINECLIFGMEFVGNMVAFTPNYGKAKLAVNRIFGMIDRKPQIQNDSSPGGQCLDNISGKVQMERVHFSYPTRKDVPILRGFSAIIHPGQTVALVGQSGCGKSTCIQLLERFYDPDSGKICIDDRDVKSLVPSSFRSHFGIVSQEVVLFNRTIAENIAYGDLTRSVSIDEIIDASKKANIHNFIVSLPLGYDTIVGQKGSQLSGGQKQRVAIARALVRNPKILLLDEATSALDSESEKLVQEALDSASQGRTCITIAHRLNTIQNADHIVVVHHGQVHELGKHEDLIELGGIYHHLWNVQTGHN